MISIIQLQDTEGLQSSVENARKLFTRYRQRLLSGGKSGKTTKVALEGFIEYLLFGGEDNSDSFIYNYATRNRPVTIDGIGRTINERHIGSIREIFRSIYERYPSLKNLYDILEATHVWKYYNGEPLIRDGQFFRSVRFPDVSLSIPNDVSWIPRLVPVNSAVIETSAIILTSGTPSISNKKLGIVDDIGIKRKSYESVYLKSHVIPLLSFIFNLPEEFFRYHDKGGQTPHAFRYEPQLQLGSRMIGSYFQNAVGIFEVDKDRGGMCVGKRRPDISNKSQARAFLRAMIDCDGDFIFLPGSDYIYFGGEPPVLEAAKECANLLGFHTTTIRPVFHGSYKMHIIGRDGNKVFYTSTNRTPSGRKVFQRISSRRFSQRIPHGYREIGTVLDRKGGQGVAVAEVSNVELTGELYQEYQYRMGIDCGKDGMGRMIEQTRPGNPVKILRYLRCNGLPIPEINERNHQTELQQLVSDEWDGDLERLTSIVERFLTVSSF